VSPGLYVGASVGDLVGSLVEMLSVGGKVSVGLSVGSFDGAGEGTSVVTANVGNPVAVGVNVGSFGGEEVELFEGNGVVGAGDSAGALVGGLVGDGVLSTLHRFRIFWHRTVNMPLQFFLRSPQYSKLHSSLVSMQFIEAFPSQASTLFRHRDGVNGPSEVGALVGDAVTGFFGFAFDFFVFVLFVFVFFVFMLFAFDFIVRVFFVFFVVFGFLFSLLFESVSVSNSGIAKPDETIDDAMITAKATTRRAGLKIIPNTFVST